MTFFAPEALADIAAAGFDTIIDVRSPAEFAEDHVPGAINLPALSNAERAEIGTIYTQDSPFKARKQGAALVARNVADHLTGPLAQMEGGWRPLVYCWRGGQRSGSFASILQQIGWRAQVLKSGYQSYRRLVHDQLYQETLPHRLILLDGDTGTAKTRLLALLAARGVQTIDLEGMAAHRGSLLGAVEEDQPAQKAFESRLAAALAPLDPIKPTLVEAESSKIGRIVLPQALWHRMQNAPRLVVTAPLAARAAYLQKAYADMVADPDALKARLDPLRRLRGHDSVNAWNSLIDAGDFATLATRLMADHYDPAYARSRRADTRTILDRIEAETLDDAGLAKLADTLAARIAAEG